MKVLSLYKVKAITLSHRRLLDFALVCGMEATALVLCLHMHSHLPSACMYLVERHSIFNSSAHIYSLEPNSLLSLKNHESFNFSPSCVKFSHLHALP